MKNLSNFFLAILMTSLLVACMSPEKSLENGNYDAAIYKSVDKLVGKKKKEKYVRALEEAFFKATNRDMATINRLKQGDAPDKWARIHQLAKQVEKRQRRVEPLLPLIDRNGIKADFQFVKVNALEQEARSNAALAHYNRALNLLEKAELGNKRAARNAYDELRSIGNYYKQYKNQEDLMERAKILGMTHVLVRMENRSRAILPSDFEQDLLQLDTRGLNATWTTYYTNELSNIDFDYEAVLKITNLDVSPGQIREREFEENKEIEDGFEYVLDENGNVAKDTLGNDIKQPRNIIVSALVLESYQRKLASIEARLELRDRKTRNLISSERLQADAIFEHYASTFQGDKRALSENTCRRIGNRPVPFPSDASLVYEVGEELKPLFKEKVKRMRVI
ncbi:MAG: hypothetical protein AAGG68_26650 [Bacteroidota bacterium]